MEKAVIGVIGCGHIAQGMHLPNAVNNPRIRLKWCCDLSQRNLDIVKEQFNPENITTDYNDVINDPEVQGVLILTVHNVRLALIKAAAEAGKHIYVEKPMSLDPKESYEIMKIIRRNNVKLVVGFNRRCAPIVTDAKALLEDQKANPKSAPWRYMRFAEEFKIPEESRTMMMIRINDDSASFKSYTMDEFVGQGTLIGEVCHFFDLACFMIGKEPVKIYTEGCARTNSVVTILFEDQSICNIFITSGGTFDHPKELFEVYYGGMSLQLDHFLQLRVGGREDIFEKEYDFLFDPYPYITEGKGTQLFINKMRERNRLVTDPQDLNWSSPNKGWAEMQDRFIDCILNDAPSPCNELDGARATLMCLKARESARLGLPVKINIDEYDYIIGDVIEARAAERGILGKT